MRIALIGCLVMNREICRLIAESPNPVRAFWLRQGLHDTPDLLRSEVQKRIDQIEEENTLLREEFRFEAIVLAYGLCSNGTLGLISRSLPLIIPRCDDCISLLLGSADRYRACFQEMPGTYWYSRGWVEQAFTPSKERYAALREEYVQDFGEDNADYLMECSNGWMERYSRCAYIASPDGEDAAEEACARQAAVDFGWEFRRFAGDNALLSRLLNGPWEDREFLVCPPGCRIAADYSERKFCWKETDNAERNADL